MTEPRLLIASNNAHKVGEFRALLEGSGWEIVSPADIGLEIDVEEHGQSYEENARLKARAFAAASGLPSLADDSGLEVDALDGQPGPLHHVFGWDGADNDERIALLLRALEGVADRRCRYKAVVIVALPDGSEIAGEGQCEGVITTKPSGAGGFGYDPVFYLPGRGKTMAEIPAEEKNRISHRARALQVVAAKLKSRGSVTDG